MLDLKNYFSLFGLPVGYQVDRKLLAERYRELQRVLHPDRFASASDHERRLSMQQAIRVNEAFETLKDPLRRGRYLLELNGIDADAVKGNTHDTLFLMEQMELREQLESAVDAPDPFAVIGSLLSEVRNRIRTLADQLDHCFRDPIPENLEQATDLLRKMQFLQKLAENAESLEAELEEAL